VATYLLAGFGGAVLAILSGQFIATIEQPRFRGATELGLYVALGCLAAAALGIYALANSSSRVRAFGWTATGVVVLLISAPLLGDLLVPPRTVTGTLLDVHFEPARYSLGQTVLRLDTAGELRTPRLSSLQVPDTSRVVVTVGAVSGLALGIEALESPAVP
jgi:hypothetical protein